MMRLAHLRVLGEEFVDLGDILFREKAPARNLVTWTREDSLLDQIHQPPSWLTDAVGDLSSGITRHIHRSFLLWEN
jgi:hypothetical protein